jgi:hypothetical protein
MRCQQRPAMAAKARRRRAPGRAHPLHQLDRRRWADRKPPRRLADRAAPSTARTIRSLRSNDIGAGMIPHPASLNRYG